MTITILPEPTEGGSVRYRAMAGEHTVVSASVGAALDAIRLETTDDRPETEGESATMVLIQDFRPDRFFTADQQTRLGELMGVGGRRATAERRHPKQSKRNLKH